ncbi:alpha/beta fold hydrolase [Nonomuraea sp. ATR24]|uniref:alpha/beta fold hydrolase n=1 Tax=Nonomuraea TaxID=83681 RepID=UPI001C5ED88A|nr:alpha/beta hydrolase [Nonomuraea ceibae]
MPTFTAPDGTRLAYRTSGTGDPLVCVPGGPTDAGYLGDLGGLSAHRRLVLLDPRGTGRSARPADPASYRCDRQSDDLEALREHLGLDRLDLLGHSGGANVAVTYAARHPANVGRLALITPGCAAAGITVTGATRRELALRRKAEPWFPAAFAALEAIIEGRGGDRDAITPFLWGRWDAAAREHPASRPPDPAIAAAFAAEGAFDPPRTRAALAARRGPVLVLAGEHDLNSPPRATAEYARLFPAASHVVQAGAGHYPWVDDPGRFAEVVAAFLR